MTAATVRHSPLRSGLLAVALLAAVSLGGCAGGSSAPSASSSPVGTSMPSTSSSPVGTLGFQGAALPSGIEAPDFHLSDQRGHEVSLSGHRGAVTLVSFVYSTCGAPCVLVAHQIRGALDQLARRVPVLLLSADPEADTPASVGRFLAQVSLGGRVSYLSGPRSRLARIWRAYHVTPPSSDRGRFARAVSVLLLDRDGRERVLFGLEQLTPEALAHDIGTLEGEPAHP
jgi:protein SCO1/2